VALQFAASFALLDSGCGVGSSTQLPFQVGGIHGHYGHCWFGFVDGVYAGLCVYSLIGQAQLLSNEFAWSDCVGASVPSGRFRSIPAFGARF
jgi:hypothetical protein